MSLKFFCRIPVLGWEIRYANFQLTKFVSSFKNVCSNYFDFFKHFFSILFWLVITFLKTILEIGFKSFLVSKLDNQMSKSWKQYVKENNYLLLVADHPVPLRKDDDDFAYDFWVHHHQEMKRGHKKWSSFSIVKWFLIITCLRINVVKKVSTNLVRKRIRKIHYRIFTVANVLSFIFHKSGLTKNFNITWARVNQN